MDKAKKEYIVYLLTGSNIGNKKENLYHAKHLVDKHCGNVSNHSPIYQTAAWGLTNQPSFYNQALQLHTFLEPENLMQTLLNIEEMLGRVRKEKMGPRIIDIDILLIENYTSNTNLLQVPHIALPFRKFALIPLADIAATVLHPILKITIAELLTKCKDDLDVQKI